MALGHLDEEYNLLVGIRLSTAPNTQGILALGRKVCEQDIILDACQSADIRENIRGQWAYNLG